MVSPLGGGDSPIIQDLVGTSYWLGSSFRPALVQQDHSVDTHGFPPYSSSALCLLPTMTGHLNSLPLKYSHMVVFCLTAVHVESHGHCLHFIGCQMYQTVLAKQLCQFFLQTSKVKMKHHTAWEGIYYTPSSCSSWDWLHSVPMHQCVHYYNSTQNLLFSAAHWDKVDRQMQSNYKVRWSRCQRQPYPFSQGKWPNPATIWQS